MKQKANGAVREAKSKIVRVRVVPSVMQWLRRAAAQRHIDISDIVRPMIMEAFDRRNAK